jgi:hypothetical protein
MIPWQRLVAALAAFGAAIMAILFYREKAGREAEKREASEAARATEQKATSDLVDGLRREQQEVSRVESEADSGRRDHFER